ncbi:hypothetical protein TEA_008332 [Camellia sinensis var. sinensis]|uniref:Myb-like domain-containing protein n=1 Tax=Camellia sinensis var. sinensis TaxID=542762 RepID=A0A4S4ESF4_CAMSN|nr:hypothetical protein TEA_008332 [Camellia sinensis var. sinensis]
MDAKDILGLPRTPLPLPQEKKSRPQKDSQRKPDGISREVYALIGGLAPLMPSIDVAQLKRRTQSENEKDNFMREFRFFLQITWQWLPFSNSARKDNLQLYHWVRVVNAVPPTGDYSFAKYNKSVDIVKYTDEEYEKHLTDPVGCILILLLSDLIATGIEKISSDYVMWTKEETDQLFDLCERFDLRFVVIADRFPSSRTVEQLKDRYYSASRAILISRASSPGDVSGHPIVKEPYNVSQEIERKRSLSMVLSQTKQQERKDAEVLAEAKKISESCMAARFHLPSKLLLLASSFCFNLLHSPFSLGAEESELPVTSNVDAEGTERAIVPVDTTSPSSSVQFASANVAPPTSIAESASVATSLRVLRVYTRTYALDQMVQAASSSAGLRTIKRVEQTLQDLGVNLKPKVPTKAVCAEHLELRKEILTLLNLQKQLQNKEAEGSSYRDGSYAETPNTPKRFQRVVDQDRTFIPEPFSFGGERNPVGKRDQKRKAPGRLSDAPSSPAQSNKRPRKLKASDG